MFRHGHRAFHPSSRMHCHRHGQSGREALTAEPLGLSCRKRSFGNDIRLSQATTDRPRAAPRAKGQPPSRRNLDNVTARPLSSQTKLHAAVRVAAGDRKRLEQLCRYAGRPAIAGRAGCVFTEEDLAGWFDGCGACPAGADGAAAGFGSSTAPTLHDVSRGAWQPDVSLRHRQRSSGC